MINWYFLNGLIQRKISCWTLTFDGKPLNVFLNEIFFDNSSPLRGYISTLRYPFIPLVIDLSLSLTHNFHQLNLFLKRLILSSRKFIFRHLPIIMSYPALFQFFLLLKFADTVLHYLFRIFVFH